jgi:hypothetical protein
VPENLIFPAPFLVKERVFAREVRICAGKSGKTGKAGLIFSETLLCFREKLYSDSPEQLHKQLSERMTVCRLKQLFSV